MSRDAAQVHNEVAEKTETPERFRLMVRQLRQQPMPDPPPLPGRVIRARDSPPTDDELAEVTDPGELALVLGIGRKRAAELLALRDAGHPISEARANWPAIAAATAATTN